ncbi:MAG: quinoprotein dehydrogenase-associated putative ABC transporter substrate-binding protein [Gammaproteobacteria bacterium]|nr:MAG: quinoprotein dehydrogenase-associated putative ABC transporter substrate-binding protein [Gammaproteobacteria bacterium]
MRSTFLAALLLAALTAVSGSRAAERTAFKVCADPYNLPMSNKKEEGYENKIARLFADDLGLPIEYTWFPQRIGFIRKTLRNNLDTPDGSYACDVVMGVVTGFELADTTKPYYRSTWAFAYVKGRGLDDIRSQEDLAHIDEERLQKIKVGVFDKSPTARWVIEHGLMEHMVPYQAQTGAFEAYVGEMVEKDLPAGKIDIAFIWGPIAGYFAKKVKEETGTEIVVVPMHSESHMQFEYPISMAVRFGEKEWKRQIEELIDRHQEEINAILRDYGVPLLPIENIDLFLKEDDD